MPVGRNAGMVGRPVRAIIDGEAKLAPAGGTDGPKTSAIEVGQATDVESADIDILCIPVRPVTDPFPLPGAVRLMCRRVGLSRKDD